MPVPQSRLTTDVLALVIFACFMAMEPRTRQGATAQSWEFKVWDRGSTKLLGAAFGTSLVLLLVALPLDWYGVLLLPGGVELGWAGVGVMVAGFALGVWSTRVLGAYFTRTLVVSEGQRIVTDGPYRFVRHPGYLGHILLWLGGGLATRNILALAVITLVTVLAFLYRIEQEEAMLRATLGEAYAEYAAKTRRLIPFVY